MSEKRLLLFLTCAALFISGFRPNDYPTWLLEVAPVLIGLGILIPTRKRFPLTSLLYWLLFFHALILIVGGHYTYANVPFGYWLQETFGFARNPYDRIGHFAQGFVPAILAREILLRKNVMRSSTWLFFITTSICLAFSAFYELIEWAVALIEGGAADAFLGTQGDVWDTQWDMFMALLGAITAQLTLRNTHDRALKKIHRTSE